MKISNIIRYLIELRHIHFLNFFLNTILSALTMPSLGYHLIVNTIFPPKDGQKPK
jgi:hypothetical protein